MNFKFFELAEFVTDRAGHDKRYAMNTQKLSDELGRNRNIRLRTAYGKRLWYLNMVVARTTDIVC